MHILPFLFQVVLSACSSYFQKLLLENPCTHPTIIMPSDVCYSDLKFIIEFVYKGEIDVSQAELQVSRRKTLFSCRLLLLRYLVWPRLREYRRVSTTHTNDQRSLPPLFHYFHCKHNIRKCIQCHVLFMFRSLFLHRARPLALPQFSQ